jgi:hypothetical protein
VKATVLVSAPTSRVHDGLSTLEGLAGWWIPAVEGDPAAGGVLTFHFGEESTTRHVDTNTPMAVEWTCREHTKFPEWSDTRITFALRAMTAHDTELEFEHLGLDPECGCYEMCSSGWHHYLASLSGWASGEGGSPRHSPGWKPALS